MANDLLRPVVANEEPDIVKNKPRTTKSALSTKSIIDLEYLQKRLLTVLYRDVSHLMLESKAKKLSSASSQALTSYLKFIKDAITEDEEKLKNLSTEELEKITQK